MIGAKMSATITEQPVHVLEILKEKEIAAPIDVVFEAILEQMGRGMKLRELGRCR
jgi:hypothetical protein